MALGNALRRVSETLGNKLGTQMTWVHLPAGEFDPEAGTYATAELKESVYGIVANYSTRELVGGVEPHDKKVTLAAKQFMEEPGREDEVKIGSDKWRVVQIDTVEQDGLPVIYNVQIRR